MFKQLNHEKETGILFQTDNDRITACDRVFEKFGIDRSMQVSRRLYTF